MNLTYIPITATFAEDGTPKREYGEPISTGIRTNVPVSDQISALYEKANRANHGVRFAPPLSSQMTAMRTQGMDPGWVQVQSVLLAKADGTTRECGKARFIAVPEAQHPRCTTFQDNIDAIENQLEQRLMAVMEQRAEKSRKEQAEKEISIDPEAQLKDRVTNPVFSQQTPAEHIDLSLQVVGENDDIKTLDLSPETLTAKGQRLLELDKHLRSLGVYPEHEGTISVPVGIIADIISMLEDPSPDLAKVAQRVEASKHLREFFDRREGPIDLVAYPHVLVQYPMIAVDTTFVVDANGAPHTHTQHYQIHLETMNDEMAMHAAKSGDKSFRATILAVAVDLLLKHIQPSEESLVVLHSIIIGESAIDEDNDELTGPYIHTIVNYSFVDKPKEEINEPIKASEASP